MSHVDEGALHAYLDGALDEYPASEARWVREHLEHCATCAEWLEDERRVRHEADSILALAVPDVPVPSFEELRAYVNATRTRPSSASVRLYRLGWAASVVLAIGVGWIVRDGQLDGAAGLRSEPAALPAESPTADDRSDRAASAVENDDRRLETAEEREAQQAISSRAFADRSTPDAGGGAVGGARQEMAVGATGEPSAVSGAVSPGPEAPPASADLLGDVVAQVVVPEAVDDVSDLEVLAGRGVTDVAPKEPVPAPGTPITVPPVREIAASTAASDAAADPTATPRDADVRSRSAEPVAARMQTTSAPAAGLRVPLAEAEQGTPGGAWLVIPGLEIVSFRNLVEGTVPMGVHVIHRLEDGRLLDLYHLPPVVEPTELPPLEAGRNEVRERRGSEWVVLRGPLDRDALAALLARMDPSR